jgi:UDP-glucuronate 4-epimerase
MRVLVTGAAGFIGAACAQALLARGDTVIGVDNLNAYYDPALKAARLARLEGPGFVFERCELADRRAVAALAAHAPDAILHLGAQAGVRHSIEAPFDYADANLLGHLAVLELARGLRVPTVYASSSSVYGANAEVPFSVEHRTDRPVSLYAATKKAGEAMSEAYAHLYRLPLTGLRFFTVYGPWGRPDMMPWLFADAMLAGRTIRLFNGGQMARDFTFIDDIVAGTLAALDRPPADDGAEKPGGSRAPHAVYNLGGDRSTPLMTFVAALEAALEVRAVTEMAPMQAGDVERTAADIFASRRDLGFAPAVPVADGVARFAHWFRLWRTGAVEQLR